MVRIRRSSILHLWRRHETRSAYCNSVPDVANAANGSKVTFWVFTLIVAVARSPHLGHGAPRASCRDAEWGTQSSALFALPPRLVTGAAYLCA